MRTVIASEVATPTLLASALLAMAFLAVAFLTTAFLARPVGTRSTVAIVGPVATIVPLAILRVSVRRTVAVLSCRPALALAAGVSIEALLIAIDTLAVAVEALIAVGTAILTIAAPILTVAAIESLLLRLLGTIEAWSSFVGLARKTIRELVGAGWATFARTVAVPVSALAVLLTLLAILVERALLGTELLSVRLLSGRDHAVIMLGVLQVVLRRNRVAAHRRVTRELSWWAFALRSRKRW